MLNAGKENATEDEEDNPLDTPFEKSFADIEELKDTLTGISEQLSALTSEHTGYLINLEEKTTLLDKLETFI